ncbi:MAG: hypothetical protein IKV73_04075 [Clostridia bacterium]|nr:hypothetical protein [Clostridia bacterium]
MKKTLVTLLICAICISSLYTPFAFADASSVEGALKFFYVDNLSAQLSFEYECTNSSNVDVKVTNLTDENVFYNATHSPTHGVIAVYDIPLVGEGSFRLEISCGALLFSRDFSYLGMEYVTDFPLVTQDDVLNKVSKLSGASHPYLFATQEEFDTLSQTIHSGTDSYLTQSYREIKETATKYLGSAPKSINPAGSYISRGFLGWKTVMHCAFVYLMEKDTDSVAAASYAQRAYDEAEYFCSLDTWGTIQYIDNNQLAFAVALCYDWLYDWLDDTQKQALTSALKTKHLDTVCDLLNNPDREEYQITFYKHYFGISNHTVLDNTATVLEALSVADIYPQFSASIIAKALGNLPKALGHIAPDSGWYEGAGYWDFAGPFLARMISALDSSIGTSFGYSQLPIVKNFGSFPLYQQSSQGPFVFCDASETLITSPEIFYFGMLNDDLAMQSYSLTLAPADPLLCIWYDPEQSYTESVAFQKDMLYRNRDTVTMRSGWENDALFAGMAVNKNDAESMAHFYQNSGTFVIDALGEHWIKNPGRDNYSLPQYSVPHNAPDNQRWKYYFSRAEANSCIVINPDKYGGQNLQFGDIVSGFDASDSEAFAYASLAGAYRDDVTSYTRGIKMFDNRSKVLVKDELEIKEPSDVYSFVSVYQSDINLLSDNTGAILSKGDKKLLVKIKANDDFELSVMDAVQMDSSLRYKGDATHPAERDWTQDYKRLALRFTEAQELDISMIFVPFYGSEVPKLSFDSGDISQWQVAHNANNLPKLSEICVDGEPVADFDANVNCHNLIARSFSPKITACSDEGAVTIRQDTGGYIITVTSESGVSNTYYITFRTQGTVEADTYISGGYSEYNKNYGSSEFVKLKHMGYSSQLAYYKINLGDIPAGKRIKNISLELSVCRQADSEFEEPLGLYLVDYNSWNESNIMCHKAPVSLKYVGSGDTPWFPLKSYNSDDDTYANVNPDVTITHNFVHTLPFGYSIDSGYDLCKERLDITELYNKGGTNGKLSFCMAVSQRQKSNCDIYIASKEHQNVELRPRVLIELEDSVSIPTPKLIDNALYEGGYSYFEASRIITINAQAPVRAIVSVSGDAANFVGGSLYVAQYSANGEVIAVSTKPLGKINTDTVSDAITISPDTARVKSFVWNAQNTPYTLADSVFKIASAQSQ